MSEHEIFQRLINALMLSRGRLGAAKWVEAGSHYRFPVQATCFVLDYDPGRDVESFVLTTLERLLRKISRVTEPLQVEYQGAVKGRVLWPETLKARHRENYDPSRYVCREVKREFDTPENQLLKFVVERIHESVRIVPQIIRDGVSCFPGKSLKILPTFERFKRIESALGNFRQNARLRSVEPPSHVTEFHLIKCETSRIADYRDVAALYRRYYKTMLAANWLENASDVTSRVLTLPENPDGSGLIWIEIMADLIGVRDPRVSLT